MTQYSVAEQLLRQLGVTEPSDIDIEAIAWYQNASVRYRPLSGCEAFIVGNAERALIVVDQAGSQGRQRFSIGHELGHWHHHRGTSLLCRIGADIELDPRAPYVEKLADGYAADLLMPRYMIAPIISSYTRLDIDAVEEISTEFATSITATAIRVVEFAPTPMIVVCYGQVGRKWFRRSPTVPEGLFLKSELDADSAALDVTYGGSARSRRRHIKASAWLSGREIGHLELLEQSIRIGDGESLTLLDISDLGTNYGQ